MTSKILFVDDDTNLLDGIQRSLRRQFQIETATGGAEGLRKLASDGPYAVIVADMQMPGMSGLEFLRAAQTQAPESVRMMLTGNADQKTAVGAVNDGRVFRFINKPCPPPILAPELEAGLQHFRLAKAERDLLENTLGGAVKVLTEILALHDPATFEHSQKLKDYVRDFVRTSNVESSWELELAAMLSQIGRVMVPPPVQEKITAGLTLTPSEKEIVQRIPEFGARLLENIPRLEKVADIVRHQQTHFDGSGHPPCVVAGADIPIGARILKVLQDLIEIEAHELSRPATFQRMQERIGHYDLNVLSAVSCWCDVAIAELSADCEPVPLRVDELRAGDVLAEDLRTPGGMLLVAANTKLTAMLIVKLLNFRTLHTIDNTMLVRRLPQS